MSWTLNPHNPDAKPWLATVKGSRRSTEWNPWTLNPHPKPCPATVRGSKLSKVVDGCFKQPKTQTVVHPKLKPKLKPKLNAGGVSDSLLCVYELWTVEFAEKDRVGARAPPQFVGEACTVCGFFFPKVLALVRHFCFWERHLLCETL